MQAPARKDAGLTNGTKSTELRRDKLQGRVSRLLGGLHKVELKKESRPIDSRNHLCGAEPNLVRRQRYFYVHLSLSKVRLLRQWRC